MCLEFMSNIFSTEPSGKFLFSRYLSRTHLTKWLWVIFMVLVLGSTISGCSPFYVMRAAYEEGKILWRREPIANFIERPGIAADTKEKLALVLAVREYAKNTLKLNVGRSYSTYSYVDRPELTYILTAAPKTELKPYTWWFLVVGRVPYKGYFSREEAETAAEDLRADGYDSNVRTSAAFSTLGWFNDPLLGHLLKYDKVTLAEVVFHELFHSTLYVKGAGNFNESVANFVGGHAAIDFFRDKFGEGSAEHQRAVRNWEAELEFSGFIERFAGALTELYTRNIPYEDKLRLREAVFSRFKNEWADRLASRSTHRFRGFAYQPMNNAVIIHYLLYLRNLEIFESVYQAEGQNLVRTIAVIRDAVEKGGEPFEQVRGLIDKHKASS
jgi:predicted aminopeptidase